MAIAATAIVASLLTASAQAGEFFPGQGAIVAPAASYAYREEAPRPRFKRGKIVDFSTEAAPGSIIINTRKHALYLILGNGQAVRYRVATAKKGFEWSGTHRVSSKIKWPGWRPPAEMRRRHPELPAFMDGGPKNPLGARAIYLGSSIYRIHGTNEPRSIGKSVSSGCIRMHNEDVKELYRHVPVGTEVTVI